MKIFLLLISMVLLLCTCSNKKEILAIEPTIENFVRYIVEEYEYGVSGEFVEKYIDNTFFTNLFLINLLRDSYYEISIVNIDETGAFLLCDDELVRMDMTIYDGRIQKIYLRGSHDD
jgi:hypothetical protein